MSLGRAFGCAVLSSIACLAFVRPAAANPRTAFDEQADREALARVVAPLSRPACDWDPQPNRVRCHAHVVVDATGRYVPMAPGVPKAVGLAPADIQSAYKLPVTGGAGKTVAIIDAYDAPTVEADLAMYRSTFNLPPCTSASGCFRKLNQLGNSTPLPKADTAWASEISIDVQMISAACPACKILLFEADSDTNTDVLAAMLVAIGMGVDAISNSFGTPEDSSENLVEKQYYAAAADGGPSGNSLLVGVSTGDTGYGAEYPATSSYVVAVGGTTLTSSSSSRGWAEAAWSKGGSGCSAYVKKPSWETDTGCKNRMEADVAAVADTATPVYFYCSDCASSGGGSSSGATAAGWYGGSGTSVAAPIVVGGLMGLGVQPEPGSSWADYVAIHHSAMFDVTSGSNGSCTTSYFCTAGVGYDGPTGWGSLDGDALLQILGGGDGGGGDAGGAVDAGIGGERGDASLGGDGSSPRDAGVGGDSTVSPDSAMANDAGGGGDAASGADVVVRVDGRAPGADASVLAIHDASAVNDSAVADARSAVAVGVDGSVQASTGGDAAMMAIVEGSGNSNGGCGCAVADARVHYADLASGLVVASALVLRRRRAKDATRETPVASA